MAAFNILAELVKCAGWEYVPYDGETVRQDEWRIYRVTTGAVTDFALTLPDPVKAGILLVFTVLVDGGKDLVITANGTYKMRTDHVEKTTSTIKDAGDCLVLLSVPYGAVGSYAWLVVVNETTLA